MITETCEYCMEDNRPKLRRCAICNKFYGFLCEECFKKYKLCEDCQAKEELRKEKKDE